MAHRISNIEKRPQGKDDPQSDWEQCRYRWVTQLLVRLGLEPDLSDFMVDGVIPPCFDKKNLKPLSLAGIVWWDEVHKDYLSPPTTYYLDEANPYKAKYGDDKDVWGEEAWITKMKE